MMRQDNFNVEDMLRNPPSGDNSRVASQGGSRVSAEFGRAEEPRFAGNNSSASKGTQSRQGAKGNSDTNPYVAFGTTLLIVLCLMTPFIIGVWAVGGFTTLGWADYFLGGVANGTGFTFFYEWWSSLGNIRWVMPIAFTICEIVWSPFANLFGIDKRFLKITCLVAGGMDLFTTYIGIGQVAPKEGFWSFFGSGIGSIIALPFITFGPEFVAVLAVRQVYNDWMPMRADLKKRMGW